MYHAMHPVVPEVCYEPARDPRPRAVPRQVHQPVVLVNPRVYKHLCPFERNSARTINKHYDDDTDNALAFKNEGITCLFCV